MSRIIAVLLLILFIYPFHSLSQQIDGAMEIDGTQRTFHLFTPDHLPENNKYPLVIMLHGGGGTGSQMSRFTHFNDWAEKDSFIVCYPDGWKRQWNDHRIGSDLPLKKDDVKFVNALIDYLVATHHADNERVFVTGISNGAMMSLFLAQELPEKIRAIAVVCGSIPTNYAQTYHLNPPISILIINGTDDPLVKYSGGPIGTRGSDRGSVVATDSMIQQLHRLMNCENISSLTSFKDDNIKDGCTATEEAWNCNNNYQLAFIKVNGGGHTWPGGFQYLPKSMVESVCKDFSATEVIWNFFQSQQPLR